MTAKRKFWVALCAAAWSGLVLGGCGGGGGGEDSDVATINTGASGRLEGAAIGPAPGATFVPAATTFQVGWSGSNTPPPQFTVALRRYLEARGGQDREVIAQRVDVAQQSGYTWSVRRRDNFELDLGGVYYLELAAPGSNGILSAFIVGRNRAASARAETVRPGTSGRLDGVSVSPTPGSVFIPKGTTFQVSWQGPTPPPSEFAVALRRYKEPRGSDIGSDEEQRITVTQQGSGFVWNVKRRDNFDMDVNGVYYLEVTAPGENPVRAAYIVSGDR